MKPLLLSLVVLLSGCSDVQMVELIVGKEALQDSNWTGTKEDLLDAKIGFIKAMKPEKELSPLDVECAGNVVNSCPQGTCGGCWERDWEQMSRGVYSNTFHFVAGAE